MRQVIVMYMPTPTYKFPTSRRGTVKQAIASQQRGRVQFEASYWPAELASEIGNIILHPHDDVQIVGRRGIVLLVEPASKT